MKRIGYSIFTALALATIALCAHDAFATPPMTGAVIKERVFNNCPSSTVVSTNAYPGAIRISDSNLDCFGFANRHIWTFSADGGATEYNFRNRDKFSFCATVTFEGSAEGEGGLRISPWYGQDVDGVFMLRTGDHGPGTSGEISCFGGRLPFYNFTAAYGIEYTRGTTAVMLIDYDPHTVSALDPATIVYTLIYGSTYSSGPLAFNQGNPSEDPPHGVWGILNEAHAGGWVMPKLGQGVPVNYTGTWANICFDAGPTAATSATWGKIKANYR